MGTENKITISKQIRRILDGSYMADWLTGREFKWIVAFAFWAFFSIVINYNALRQIRHIDSMKKELTELRLERIALSSNLMSAGRLTSIEKRVKEENLKIGIPKTPPIIIK